MTTHAEDVDAALVEAVCARVRERVDAGEREQCEEFVRQYFHRVPREDLAERDPLDLYGAALAHFGLARRHAPGEVRVHVYNPRFEQHGWQSTHTVAELVTGDMPFLVDSTAMEVARLGAGLHLVIHPVMRVVRDAGGALLRVLEPDAPPADGETAESYIHVELDRRSDPRELERFHDRLVAVLEQVRAAVDDWPAMRERAHALVDELAAVPAPLDAAEAAEAAALLRWMADHHFTFLGFREYELVALDGGDGLLPVHGSGLGILRDPPAAPPRERAG
ncbi:MAG TPA: hypothetical protein VLA98_05345, partial [Solirubrobacteraceae bacterium]|nr:hypothetical protein [Solirubrobacteraceae bacterium]